ncbi:MAG: TetR family transcriptional regulator [Bryobacteraceae bacterium]
MAGLLQAAALVISDKGYEAATMSGVAERAGASIGSLYQFFPNKEAVAQALRSQYSHQLEELWVPLGEHSKLLEIERFLDRLIDVTINFADEHPAFLTLLDAPLAAKRSGAIRKRFCELIARFFVLRKPHMSKVKALRMAAVTLKVIHGMMVLYKDAKRREKPYIVREFKLVLSCYLNRGMS